MYLPKEKQFFIPYLNGVDMFCNANVTCNTVYTCKMLKTMCSSLASLSGYGVCLKKKKKKKNAICCYWLYGLVSAHSLNLSI